MPERRVLVPQYAARVSDLRVGCTVEATCKNCRHRSEVATDVLRANLPADFYVKNLGFKFRCQSCGHRGARLDARRALGY